MANQQHIEWLLEGVEAWNARRETDYLVPDFSRADVSDLIKNSENFSSRRRLIPLVGYDFERAIFTEASLRGADLTRTRFFADLRRADFSDSRLTRADFAHSDLSGAWLPSVDISRANLQGANLTGADLRKANLTYADFERADLTGQTSKRLTLPARSSEVLTLPVQSSEVLTLPAQILKMLTLLMLLFGV